MALYVTDTHPLIWYTSGQFRRLSNRVVGIFQNASRGRALVYIPAMVVWEVALLLRQERIKLRDPFEAWVSTLARQNGYDLVPLDVPIITTAHSLRFTRDLFDLAIVATAVVMDAPLMTKDQVIIESGAVETIW